jgi:hypothetical protein
VRIRVQKILLGRTLDSPGAGAHWR